MTHYAMCTDKDCPSRNRCFRFMATPDPLYQTYADFRRGVAWICDGFIQFYGAPVTAERPRQILKLRYPA